MKNLLLVIGLVVGLGVSAFAQTSFIATNISTAVPVLLTTNRASIQSIELTSDKAVALQLFNIGTTNEPYFGTNYVTAAFTYRTSYSTNYVTSYVGNTGFTNWYTNAGLWTLTLTNAAATNALSPGFAGVVGANAYAVYPVDLLFERGIVARATTNCSIVINYRPGN